MSNRGGRVLLTRAWTPRSAGATEKHSRHVATAPNPLTGKEFVALAESYEMLYQSDSPYLFDSSKFAREFGFAGSPWLDD